MPVQTKEKHFKRPQRNNGKVTNSISALETKMMNNHKTLMNKVETINRKMDKALHLAKKK